MVELESLFYFLILKFAQVVNFDKIVVGVFLLQFSLVDIKEWLNGDSFFGGDDKLLF